MTRPRLPLLRAATRLAALALATAGVLLTVATPASAAVPTGRYVALGDSYTAGPLTPPRSTSTAYGPTATTRRWWRRPPVRRRSPT